MKSEKKRNSVAVVSNKSVLRVGQGKKICVWKSNASRAVKGDIKVVIRQSDMERNAKNMNDMAFSFHF